MKTLCFLATLLALAFTAPSFGAVNAALVGTRGTSATNTVTTGSGTSTASGSKFAIGCSWDLAANISTVTDSKSNTYAAQGTTQTVDGNHKIQWYACTGTCTGGASHTATVTFSATAFPTCHLVEITGAATSSPIDKTVNGTNTTSPYASAATGTLAQANEVVLSLCAANAGSDGAYAFSNMTLLSSEPAVSSFWTSGVGKQVVASTASFTPSCTRTGSSGNGSDTLITFKAEGAGGGPANTAAFLPFFALPTGGAGGGGGSVALGGHGLGVHFIGSGGSVTTSSFTSTTNDMAIACVGRGQISDFATQTVSDNKGNGNYAQVGGAHGYTGWPTSGTALFQKTLTTGGSGHTVTATKSAGANTDEVTVLAATASGVSAIVDSQWNEDLTSPNTSASVTTTGPAILFSCWFGNDTNGELNPAVSSGWTVIEHTSSLASSHIQGALAYRIVSGAGTYSIDWTPSTSQGAQLWIAAIQ